MSASVTNSNLQKSYLRECIVWLSAAAFCGIFSIVYEINSHGVYSAFMIFLFAVPLCLGAIPYGFLSVFSPGRQIGRPARNLYASGIATLTVGCCLRGVMEIYGTETSYQIVYWIVGGMLLISGIWFACRRRKSPQKAK